MMRLTQEALKIFERAVDRVDRVIIRNIVTIVLQRGRIKWQKPNCGHAQVLQIVQFLGEAAKSPMPSALLSKKART